MLHLVRGAWPMVKRPRQGTNQPPPPRASGSRCSRVKLSTFRRFAEHPHGSLRLMSMSTWLGQRNLASSVPAWYGCEGQWSYDCCTATHEMSTPPAPARPSWLSLDRRTPMFNEYLHCGPDQLPALRRGHLKCSVHE